MTYRAFKFFICTRDRPKVLEQCILSLAQSFSDAFPGTRAEGYIFDDSTTRDSSNRLYDTWNGKRVLGLELHLVNSDRQKAFLRELTDLEPEYQMLLKASIKELGQGHWDLAGVRNFAFLFAYCSSDDN